MPTYACPKGHSSTEPDFCSDCGAKIQNGSSAASMNGHAASTAKSAPAPQVEHDPCPDCDAPRGADAGTFCEVCGYNFLTGAHGEIPSVSAAAGGPVSVTPAVSAPAQWSLLVVVDPSLRAPESPEAPPDAKPATINLLKPVNLIGRSSATRGITPEIPLDHDDAVSHRHGLINLGADGTLTLRDIGSANGTKLNDVEIKPMVDTPLHDGDQILVGHWTRITVKSEKAP